MTGTGPTTVTGEEWNQLREGMDNCQMAGFEPMFDWVGAEVVYVVWRDGQVNKKEHIRADDGMSLGINSSIVREPIV